MISHSNNTSKYFILFYFILLSCTAQSQIFTGISSDFDDSSISWTLFYLDEESYEDEAILRMKWPFRNDWTIWTYELEDEFYDVELEWNRNPQLWILNGFERDVRIQQKWRSDLTEWTISDGTDQVKWESEYKSDLNAWYFETPDKGFLEMWTIWENDTRDWEINDQTIDISTELKLACIFITAYVLSPRQ